MQRAGLLKAENPICFTYESSGADGWKGDANGQILRRAKAAIACLRSADL